VQIISKLVTITAMSGLALLSGAHSSYAGGGEVAAGLFGGLAAGAIIGAATAPRPSYYYPPPAYAAPPPAYIEPAPYPTVCRWTYAEPVWDGYSWVRRPVQVCD
jgi:hypothetical protein